MRKEEKLEEVIDKYISLIVCGSSWDIDKYKFEMKKEIEDITEYKKNKGLKRRRRMKILFIETPNPQNVRAHAQIPLGLLYLSTVVKQAGNDVTFARPSTISEIEQYKDYDIVCLSSTTLEYPMTCNVAKFIREKFKETKILIGGTHATALPLDVKNSNLFDAICVGEGEVMILNMIEDVIHNDLQPIYYSLLMENIDDIPFPNRSLIEGQHGGRIFMDIETTNENIITSRGCPFNCAFCASQSMWDRKVRYRSINNIVAEIEDIIEKYNTKVFRIADDNVTSNPKRCLEFCKAIAPLNIEWRCSIRAESITKEMAQALYNAGCREISPGIESGDQRVLDHLNKNTTLEKMRVGCENAKKAGLKVRALMMIGTPGERKDTPEINRDYLKILPYDMVTLSTFVPLPGTPIWNKPEQFNCEILTKDFMLYNKDYYVSAKYQSVKRSYTPLIHNRFLTLKQQIDNVKRMEQYIEELGKYNRG